MKQEILDVLEERRKYLYKLYDEEIEYGVCETTCELQQFKELMKVYKESDNEYNLDGFIDFLNDKGYTSQLIGEELDGEVYF
jgi:hypothetical protein